MPKLKLPLPLSGGINTQASPSQKAQTQLRNARNAFYKRDDMTLRRRPDLTFAGGTLSAGFVPRFCTYFGDTNRTFNKFVYGYDVDAGFGPGGFINAMDVETGAITSSVGANLTPGIVKTVQYNNILYIPSTPASSGGTVQSGSAWNGTSAGVRESGIEILNHGVGNTTFTINTAGAGALTFATGRSYTFTLYDPVADVESMPANNGSTLRTVNTGVIAGKGPVVTVTWVGLQTPNNNNTNNNHTQVKFYATTDGGATYYYVATASITPDANTVGATASFTDSTLDTTLVANALLVFNSPPPPAKFMAKFQNKLVAGGAKNSNVLGSTGEGVVSNVLYYSLTDEPEHWQRNFVFNTSINAVPFKDQDGENLLGAIQVNRVLLVGLDASVWTINNLPIAGQDPLFDFSTLKDRITKTHGFVSPYCYDSLNLTDDEDGAFYVSQIGFHINNGSIDRLVSGDIRWDSTVYNSSQLGLLHVINDTANYIIIIGFASVNSSVVDSAYVYHYHPSHINEEGVGKITGPWDYNVACSTLTTRVSNVHEMWGVTSSPTATNSIVKLTGTSGVDYSGSPIPFEWATGWIRMSDDASARLREINFTVEEADTSTVALGSSTLSQVVPKVRFLQLNSSGPVLKVLWDDDSVTVKQITGTGDEIPQSAGSVDIISSDRAIVSASIDVEVYGEEKTLAILAV